MYRVELSKRALRALRRIEHKSRKRLLDLLEGDLATEPQPANLDIKPLTGRAPWLRVRRGEYRVLYRPLTSNELRSLSAQEQAGFLVERVVDRGRGGLAGDDRSCARPPCDCPPLTHPATCPSARSSTPPA